MLFLPPNQQRTNTEGTKTNCVLYKYTIDGDNGINFVWYFLSQLRLKQHI